MKKEKTLLPTIQAVTHHAESRRVRHALAVDREGVGGLRGLLARRGEDAEGAARRHISFRWNFNSIEGAKVIIFRFFFSLFIFSSSLLSSAATKRESKRKKKQAFSAAP